MPDTAIDPNAALAPPPGWTPPSSPTPMDVNPATMGGTPQLPPPTQPNVTAQDPSSSAYAPTIGATDPELAAGHAHQSWLGHIMDVVGSILGGDQTIHVTKSPDGTMTVTHDPSTSAEKWGRVAQAALMGGAAGLANGQGPGGTARAVAAGVQAGAQQQPQQLAQANQQAAASNTQMLAAANNAMLHQKLVQAGLESQQLGLTIGKEQSDLLNGMADAAKNSPNAKVLPSVGSMDEIMRLQASYADFFKTHTNNQMKVFVTPDAQGKVRFTPVIVDTAYNDRLNDHPEQSYSVDVDPDTHEPIMKVTGIPVGSQPQGQIDAAKQANALKYLGAHNQWITATSGADKKEAPPVPKSAQEALAMAALEKDPTRKQMLTDLAPQMQRMEIAQKAAGRAPAAGTAEDYQTLAADLNAGRVDISQIRTRKDWPQMYAAASQYAQANGLPPFDPATASAKYKARTQAIADFTDRKEADQIQSLNNFFGHAQDLMDVTQRLRNPTDMPILNTPINKLETQYAGDPRLALLRPKIAVVRKEYQAFLENNRALHNEDITAGNEMMNDNMTPAQMENAVKGFAGAAITRAATTAQRAHTAGFDEIIPHIINSNSRRTIANMGLQNHLNDAWQDVGGPTPQTQATPNTSQAARAPGNVVPAGATPGRDAQGNVIGYRTADGKVVRF